MKFTRNALALGFAVASISAAACSSQHGSTGSTGGTDTIGVNGEHGGNVGQVGLHLFIPNSSATISSLNWTITNGTNTYTGTINMTDDAGNAAQSIEFVAGPVVAGTGYTVTLTGSDSSGDPCTGTSPAFAVTAGTSVTAQAGVTVQCTVPADAAVASTVDSGSVAVDAGVVLVNQAAWQCPGITGVSISPAELKPPETAALNAGVLAGVGGSQTLLWSATCVGGPTGSSPTIANPTSANTTFSCGTAVPSSGVAVCSVTLTVGLDGTSADGGTVGQVCSGITNTSIVETIACEPGGITLPTCAAGQSQCGTATSDCETLSNGSGPNQLCGTTCATATVCSGATPICNAGVCGTAPATACTTTPCAASGPNSIQCTGNHAGTGVCTQTEAAFVNLDPTLGCYACLQSNFCLDNAHQLGFECDDLAGNFTNGAGTSVSSGTACLNTLTCDIGPTGQNCPNDPNGISDCYCGAGGGASATCAASTAQNGPCLTSELAGFAYTPGATAANTILGEFTTQTQPSGNANALAACAQSNCTTQCVF